MERLASSAGEFTWQWSEASTVTSAKFKDDSLVVIPITPATAPLIAPLSPFGSPQSFSASAAVFRLRFPDGDNSMRQEPAACGGSPAQHAIVQRFPAEADLKGAMPDNNDSTRTTATTTRSRNSSLIRVELKRCT